MAGYAEYDQVWLVKSAGMVLGPFSLVELAAALRERRVSILDEVRNPKVRWAFVREQPNLASIVLEVRHAETHHEQDTGRTATGDKTATRTVRITGSAEAALSEEITPIPEHVRVEPKERPDRRQSKAPVKQPAQKTTAVKSNLPVPAPLPPPERASSGVGAFIVGVVLAGAVIGGTWFFVKQAPSESMGVTDLLQLARKERDRGAYEKSIALLQRAQTRQHLDANTQSEFIPEMLLYPQHAKMAAALLADPALSTSGDEKMLWDALARMGLGNNQEAAPILKELVAKDSKNTKVQLNSLLNHLLLGNDAEVLESARGFFSSELRHPLFPVIAGWAELSLLRLQKQNSVSHFEDMFTQTIANLEADVESDEYLRFEKSLLLAALTAKHSPEKLHPAVDRLLQVDPKSAHSFLAELEVDQQIFDPHRWTDLCTELQTQAPSAGLACAGYEGTFTTVEPLLTKMRQENKAPAVVATWSAVIERENAHWMQAKEAAESGVGMLALRVLLESCLQLKDYQCVSSHLDKLDEKNNPLFAAEMRSRLFLGQNKRDLARQELDKVIAKSHLYRPLMEMQEEVFGF